MQQGTKNITCAASEIFFKKNGVIDTEYNTILKHPLLTMNFGIMLNMMKSGLALEAMSQLTNTLVINNVTSAFKTYGFDTGVEEFISLNSTYIGDKQLTGRVVSQYVSAITWLISSEAFSALADQLKNHHIVVDSLKLCDVSLKNMENALQGASYFGSNIAPGTWGHALDQYRSSLEAIKIITKEWGLRNATESIPISINDILNKPRFNYKAAIIDKVEIFKKIDGQLAYNITVVFTDVAGLNDYSIYDYDSTKKLTQVLKESGNFKTLKLK